MKEIVTTLAEGSNSWQIDFAKITLDRKVAAGASGVVSHDGAHMMPQWVRLMGLWSLLCCAC